MGRYAPKIDEELVRQQIEANFENAKKAVTESVATLAKMAKMKECTHEWKHNTYSTYEGMTEDVFCIHCKFVWF